MTDIKKEDRIVTFKLTTGEDLVGVLRGSDDNSVTVEYPFVMRSHPHMVRPDRIEETITANAFCSMAADRIFTFKKQDIMFMKDLHEHARPFYLNMYREQEHMRPVSSRDISNYEERVKRFLERMQEGEDPEVDEEEWKLDPDTTIH